MLQVDLHGIDTNLAGWELELDHGTFSEGDCCHRTMKTSGICVAVTFFCPYIPFSLLSTICLCV
jgi:hypothetical protein